jgi:hypothetical protein
MATSNHPELVCNFTAPSSSKHQATGEAPVIIEYSKGELKLVKRDEELVFRGKLLLHNDNATPLFTALLGFRFTGVDGEAATACGQYSQLEPIGPYESRSLNVHLEIGECQVKNDKDAAKEYEAAQRWPQCKKSGKGKKGNKKIRLKKEQPWTVKSDTTCRYTFDLGLWSCDPYPDDLFDPEERYRVWGTMVVPAGTLSNFCVHYTLTADEQND